MSSVFVADMILQQMGGIGKIRAMTGATQFVYTDDSVGFKFKGSKVMNGVRIVLNGSDLYNMTFYKGAKEVKAYQDVYNDQLKELFEQTTGLHLSL